MRLARFSHAGSLALMLLAAGCLTPGTTLEMSGSQALPVASPRVFFFDDAETPTPWTIAKQAQFRNSFPAEAESPVVDAHPLAAGWHVTSAKAFNGSKSWTMADEQVDGYHSLEFVTMTSPPIDTLDATNVHLRFALWGSAEDGADLLLWSASKDGVTWQKLDSISSTKGNWMVAEKDLSKLAGPSLQIRFQFTADYSCGTVDGNPGELCGEGPYVGFYIDDIVVQERLVGAV